MEMAVILAGISGLLSLLLKHAHTVQVVLTMFLPLCRSKNHGVLFAKVMVSVMMTTFPPSDSNTRHDSFGDTGFDSNSCKSISLGFCLWVML